MGIFLNKLQSCRNLSHLLSFYLFWAQRLRCSQSDVKRLAPELAVTALGSWGCCRRNPCRSHRWGGGRVGNRRWDNTCLHCRGGERRMGGSLHLTHITKTDGALQRKRHHEHHQNQHPLPPHSLTDLMQTTGGNIWVVVHLQSLSNPLQRRSLDGRQQAGQRRHPGYKFTAFGAGLLEERTETNYFHIFS